MESQSVLRFRRSYALYSIAKIGGVILLPMLGTAGSGVAYLGLAAWAILGARRAFEALTLLVLLTFLNPTLYPSMPEGGSSLDAARWIVLACAFVTGLRHGVSGLSKTFVFMALFATSAFFSTVWSDWADVGLFKLLMFALGTTTICLIFRSRDFNYEYARDWLVTMAVVIVALSLPTYRIPSIGFAKNQTGFQGIFSHPQAFAVYLAPTSAWLLCMVVTGEFRSKIVLLATLLAVFFLFSTQARTGALALSLGLSAALVVGPFIVRRSTLGTSRVPILLSAGALVSFIVLATNGDAITSAAFRFIQKGSDAEYIGEAFTKSRGASTERSMMNFYENQTFGIGFGIASESGRMVITRDKVFGLPISAPVEKGNVVVAVLEETGLVGFGAFLALVLSCVCLAAKTRQPASVALAVSALGTNIGEATLFSIGGLGLYIWICLLVSQMPPQQVEFSQARVPSDRRLRWIFSGTY